MPFLVRRAIARAVQGIHLTDEKGTIRVLELRSDQDQNIIERGFTLVELLIVIVILGILAGIVVFAVGNLTSSAQKNSCAQEKSTIITADEAYKAQTGSYTDTTGLVASGLLKTTPAGYYITATGQVNPISGNANGCT